MKKIVLVFALGLSVFSTDMYAQKGKATMKESKETPSKPVGKPTITKPVDAPVEINADEQVLEAEMERGEKQRKTAEQIADLRVEQLDKKVGGLTEAQRQQARVIFLKSTKDRMALRGRKEEQGVGEKIKAIRKDTHTSITNILTAEQREAFKANKEAHGEHGKGHKENPNKGKGKARQAE